MNIDIRVIAHSMQRYPTVGDWQFTGDFLHITVSDMGDWRYHTLVGVHELVEAVLCRWWRIGEADVDAWDLKYPAATDPGSIPGCPYGIPHALATAVEFMLAGFLQVDWSHYTDKVKSL
jgi:hypothetical protein